MKLDDLRLVPWGTYVGAIGGGVVGQVLALTQDLYPFGSMLWAQAWGLAWVFGGGLAGFGADWWRIERRHRE